VLLLLLAVAALQARWAALGLAQVELLRCWVLLALSQLTLPLQLPLLVGLQSSL
jgi:hypothetical protein